jgi:peptide/nickel transport system permease protein
MEALPAPSPGIPADGEGARPTRRVGRRFPFARFIARRLGAAVLTLIVASIIIFIATNALPGNVADAVLGKNASQARVALLDKQLGLDRPLVARYWQWAGGILHGNLGQSAAELAQGASKAPITALIGTPLRNSLILAAITALLLLPLALLVGTVAAVRAGTAADYTLSYTALVLGSMPEFVLGSFLVLIFFTQLNLLPPVALVPPGATPLSHPSALVLPVLTLLGVSVAFCARQVRAGVVESLKQDYVMTARLGGIPERRVLWRFALRNALAPSIQSFAQTLQYLLGGLIVVESLFAYPGIGQLLVQAVQLRDVTEVQAIALILAAAYILINIGADLCVVFLVPKLRTGVT